MLNSLQIVSEDSDNTVQRSKYIIYNNKSNFNTVFKKWSFEVGQYEKWRI